MTLPTNRSTSNTTAQHVADHNTLHAAFNARGVVNVRDYGAVGDGATDDTAAITAAIAALGTADAGYAKTLYFPASSGAYLDSANRTFGDGVSILGDNPMTHHRQGTPPSEWRFTGTGASSFISARDTIGFRIEGMAIRYTSATFTGRLLDLRSDGSVTWCPRLDRVLFSATPQRASAMCCIDVNGVVGLSMQQCFLADADNLITIGAGGGSFANQVAVRDCAFMDAGTRSIDMGNSCSQWLFESCAFEPRADGDAGQVRIGGSAHKFNNCGFWDVDGTTPWFGTDVGWNLSGVSFDSCFFQLSQGGRAFAIRTCDGLSIVACTFDLYGAATAAQLFTASGVAFTNYDWRANHVGTGITDNHASV